MLLTGPADLSAAAVGQAGGRPLRTSNQPYTHGSMSSISVFRMLAASLIVLMSAVVVDAQRGAGARAGGPGGGAAAVPQGRGQTSPASVRPPVTKTPQQYPAEQVAAGRTLFAAQCGFCHGRDAAGGAGGTDLTRSELVAGDVRGDQLAPVIRAGRPARGMPAFTLSEPDLAAIVAFIHDQKAQLDAANGGRRSVDVADLQTGNAAAGQKYFEANCVRCHVAGSAGPLRETRPPLPGADLSGIATRLRGLALLQRMLYPSQAGRGNDPSRITQTVAVTLRSGQVVTGKLAYRDEFTIALFDAAGWYRSWPTAQVTFTVDDPLQAHVEQLGKYTDDDMHNVLAYLQTLR
jgi:cytochrome c oxidase cbb3-type subunit III